MSPRTYPRLLIVSLLLLLCPLFKASAQPVLDTIRQFAKLNDSVTLSFPLDNPTPVDIYQWIDPQGEASPSSGNVELFIPFLDTALAGIYELQRSVAGFPFEPAGYVALDPLCMTNGGESAGCYVCRELVVRFSNPQTRTDTIEPYFRDSLPVALLPVDSCRCDSLVLYRLNTFDISGIDIETISDNAEEMVDVEDTEFSVNFFITTGPVPDEKLEEVEADTAVYGQGPPVPPGCGNPVRVAIIDSGNQHGHWFFNPGVDFWHNNDAPGGGDNDGNCLIDDEIGYDFLHEVGGDFGFIDGHGTHISGIILENNFVTGSIELMDLKFYEPGLATLFDAVCAMYYAVDEGAQVMNLSWGFNNDTPVSLLTHALDAAQAADIVVVASAGNDAEDNDAVFHWPSNYTPAYDNMVSVAAATIEPGTSTFPMPSYRFAVEYSNYSSSGINVDFAAPGTFIESTYPDNTTAVKSGTSMAAAYVSRVAALGRSCKPAATAAQIAGCLFTNLLPVAGGPGLIDQNAAYDCIFNPIEEEPMPTIQVEIYPLPFTDRIMLDLSQFPSLPSGQFTLFHASGSLIGAHEVQGGQEQEIRLKNLPPGIYFYQLRLKDRLFSGKLIRQ